MITKPLVSGIIIFHNAERFLTEAIESVFAQTYLPWELLLVDDGSSDRSANIAQRYAAQRPAQIRYLDHPHHDNRGMAASRNLGIAHARGHYVGFLDADDVWVAEKLEQQVAILETHSQAAMVYGRTKIWHSWTQQPHDQERDRFYELGVDPDRLYEPPLLFQLLLTNQYQTPTTCNALMRRAVFEDIGGFEESFRGMFEDQTFFAKLTLERPVFVSGTCWAFYRQHPESCSEKTFDKYAQNRLTFLDWLASYLAKKRVFDPTLQRALRFEVWRCRYPKMAWLVAWLRVPWDIAAGLLRPQRGGARDSQSLQRPR